MLRKHLVKFASLVQEVILRLINSALSSSNNGHPRVTAQEMNTVLPAFMEKCFKNHAVRDCLKKYPCLPSICIIQDFYKCFGY